jgi:hypothetical protein
MTRYLMVSACVLCFVSNRVCAQDVKTIEPDKALKIARLCTSTEPVTPFDLPCVVPSG